MNRNEVELQCRVKTCLQSKRFGLGRLRVDVDGGIVSLKGHLPSFYHKQVAISCAQHVPNVMRVIDSIVVDSPSIEHRVPAEMAR
ncbi:MAG: BON domain-containing protein [Planctomycetales bacterium]|nr:BON domain-containing protein [Planctomycetales bacterium]